MAYGRTISIQQCAVIGKASAHGMNHPTKHT